MPPLELRTPEVMLSEVLRLFGKQEGGGDPRGDYEISIWGVRQEAERAKGDVQSCTKSEQKGILTKNKSRLKCFQYLHFGKSATIISVFCCRWSFQAHLAVS